MRLHNGAWQCAYCHAELNIPQGTKVRELFIGEGGKRNLRALLVDGREIHRCEVRAPMPASS